MKHPIVRALIVGICIHLSGLAPLAQAVLDAPGNLFQQQRQQFNGFSNLRVSKKSADGREAELTMNYSYDGRVGLTAQAFPVIAKRKEAGVSGWFGADPVTINRGRGTVTFKVTYFNDEIGVPPEVETDRVRVWMVNSGGTARIADIPFIKKIQWGDPSAIATRPAPVLTLSKEEVVREAAEAEAVAAAEAKLAAEAEARARAKAEALARQKAEAEQRAKLLADQKAAEAAAKARLEEEKRQAERERLEAERRAQEEARLAAERAKREAERLAQEEAKRKAEEDLRLAALRKAQEEARLAAEEARREKERLAREEAERKRAEEIRLAAERKAREEARLAAEKARLEEERLRREEAEARRKAEQARLAAARKAQEEARKAAEKARLERERLAREEAARKKAEEVRLAAEAKAREEARLAAEKARLERERLAKEEAERKRAEEARLAAERKAQAEAKLAAEKARLERERLAREEAERLAAEKKAQEAARLAAAKAEAERRQRELDLKRAAEEERKRAAAEAARLATALREAEALARKQEAERKAADERAKQVAASQAVSPSTPLDASNIVVDKQLRSKITNMDIVNRSRDRTKMTVGLEFDYRDKKRFKKPVMGVDVFSHSDPQANGYFKTKPAELGNSRRNFLLLPVSFAPPANLVSKYADFTSDSLAVYLMEAAASQKLYLFPATMLLRWRAPGAAAAAPSKTNNQLNSLTLGTLKQNDPHSGYVTIRYKLQETNALLVARVFDSTRPASADWFFTDEKTLRKGRGMQLIQFSVDQDAPVPSKQFKVDTVEIQMQSIDGKVLNTLTQKVQMNWVVPD